ncbi:protein CfxQ homolog [Pistacia vera]|uniref:protein CfxQ homolog n=1 Tax=Pistacia vera TaxID=55513 RepID=UPI001262CC4A|nr:protein CfxQ homolog [Pistacia vera]
MENGQDKQPPGSEKLKTIHDSAQLGDIDGFQKLLQNNPYLLNERNPFRLETPLHVSASNNKTQIVKFLLEWKGDDKVDLEAKNVRGETPLHVAAKNGCNEAARLLLAHGALVEAKTKYGVTPLNLSVRHSIRAEDCSIVETLLENNADCDATDDEGMTPIDHLSKIQESGKLRDLLLSRQQEQRKTKLLEACSKQNERMDALEKELSNIVGLDGLKMKLRKWAKGILMNERRKAIGLEIGTAGRLPHMAFLGNPGTGKTMVARIVGRLLHSVGILQTDNVKEVRGTDLASQTGYKTRKKIKEAEGGILFVDEAYRLIPEETSGPDFELEALEVFWFGASELEALEEIMSCMDNGKVLVIFSGYNEAMQCLISSNERFSRRVAKIFEFEDLSCLELANILHFKMNNQAEDSLIHGFKLHSSCSVNAIAELIRRATTEKQRMKMNGSLVEIMLNNAKRNLDLRISDDCAESDELLTIKLEDFEAAMRFFTPIDV